MTDRVGQPSPPQWMGAARDRRKPRPQRASTGAGARRRSARSVNCRLYRELIETVNGTPDTVEDAHISELARGASLAFANAVDLFQEAKALSASGARSRALFLHQVSLEECGKIEMIGWWATRYLMGTPVDFSKMAARLSNHRAKNFANAYMLPLCETQQKARAEADWHREHEAFKEQQAAFHQQSNDNKNASLYVDLVDGVFVTPSDRITEEMLQAVAQDNEVLIDLMRPKVDMLTSWKKKPDAVRKSLEGFDERMKALRDENLGNPREAVDAILRELMARAQGGQSGPGE